MDVKVGWRWFPANWSQRELVDSASISWASTDVPRANTAYSLQRTAISDDNVVSSRPVQTSFVI
jgi:hypothetical protein